MTWPRLGRAAAALLIGFTWLLAARAHDGLGNSMIWGAAMVGFRFLLAIGEGAFVWSALLTLLRRHPGASHAGCAIALPALGGALLLQALDLARPSALGVALPHLTPASPLAFAWLLAAALLLVGVASRFAKSARWQRATSGFGLALFVIAHAVAVVVVRDDTFVRGLRVMGPRFTIVALLAGAAAMALARIGSRVVPDALARAERDFLALAMMGAGAMWSVGTVRWVSRLFAAGPTSRPELWSLLAGRHAVGFWLMASCIAVVPPLLVLTQSRRTVAIASAWVLTAQALDSWLGVVVPLEFQRGAGPVYVPATAELVGVASVLLAVALVALIDLGGRRVVVPE